MNNPINTGIEELPRPATPVKKPSFLGNFLAKIPTDKIPLPVKQAFAKFYSNKIIFWPVTIVFGLLFLVIILGLLFGNKGGAQQPVQPRVTPTPFVQATPSPCSDTDTLCQTGNKLKDLNDQINSLDLNQSRLNPPRINYDISF